jgi:ABC-type nitrate/sulfonate/bicarbonate transport system ATPase subunit
LVVLVAHDVEEALLLSQKVVVRTERPARVEAEIEVTHAKCQRHELLLPAGRKLD